MRIVALGDSVTFGFGVLREQAYPAALESILNEGGGHVEVFNVSLFGWSTQQERTAYHRIARKYNPHVVILGVCPNDIIEIRNNTLRPPRLLMGLYRHSHLLRGLMKLHTTEIRRVKELFEQSDSPRVQAAWSLFLKEVEGLAEDVK